MAESDNGAAAAAQAPQVKMQILGQFIRDLSFENIAAQKGVQGQVQPEIQVQVALDGKKRPVDNQFEVMMKFNITSSGKDTDEKLFLMELDYGGIFLIENVPDAQMHPFLMIECPRMLFPFVRRIISDVTRDGGFPPVNVDNIDFVNLYRQQLAQRQAQQGTVSGDQPAPN